MSYDTLCATYFVQREDEVQVFTKVLIANRGETSVRVQQTLQAMSIAAATVYWEPEATGPQGAKIAPEALGGTGCNGIVALRQAQGERGLLRLRSRDASWRRGE